MYDIELMPPQLRIDLTSNALDVARPPSAAEIFRDMCAVLETIVADDQAVVQSRLERVPSIQEYLGASRKEDQAKIEDAFADALTICASTRGSLDKYCAIIRTPTREEICQSCNSGAGMEIFTLNMDYEMSQSLCYEACLPGE